MPDNFSFSILKMNDGYDKVFGLITKVKVTDTRDNNVVFSGRIIPITDSMESDGKFIKNVECESAMAYLNDTRTRRWRYQDQTPTQILTDLLTKHNNKVDDSRKIYLGTVEITQSITIDTNYETTLNAIITKLHNILGGDLQVRETAGVLYLDYLNSIESDNGVQIRLGYNQKSLVKDYDPNDLITTLIPLGYGEGINQLGISGVNSGVDYLENAEAVNKYGIMEGQETNKDIQNANTLKIWGQNLLDQNCQEKVTVKCDILDLSTLGIDSQLFLGDTVNIINSVMDFNVNARVIEKETDLLNPQNPSLTLDTRKNSQSDQITELKQRTAILQNAPQGNTFINSIPFNGNMDESHSIKIPIWLSPDILYVNRVRLFIESQKFRAYEKGMAGGGGTTTTTGSSSKTTSDSGGQSTQTSSSGGSSTQTSSSAGQSTQTSAAGGDHKHVMFYATSDMSISPVSHSVLTCSDSDGNGIDFNIDAASSSAGKNLYTMGSSGTHSHSVTTPSHTHSVNIPAHTHDVTIPSHTHGMDHIHSITIPDHTHEIQYGIFEDTYPADVQIKVNGQVISGINLTDGSNLDIEISQYIGEAGQTYTLEITSSRRGRIAGMVDIQAFIQTK